MQKNINKQVIDWIKSNKMDTKNVTLHFFDNRNTFQDKLTKVTQKFLEDGSIEEGIIYIVSAMIGEIGNNSFDHNIGNWPEERGIVFGYRLDDKFLQIIIADRGQGVLTTLKSVRPNLKNDKQALNTAFTEIVSGRAPEARGNGLKFVKQNINNNGMELEFVSGESKVILNGGMIIDNVKNKYQGCLAILKVKI